MLIDCPKINFWLFWKMPIEHSRMFLESSRKFLEPPMGTQPANQPESQEPSHSLQYLAARYPAARLLGVQQPACQVDSHLTREPNNPAIACSCILPRHYVYHNGSPKGEGYHLMLSPSQPESQQLSRSLQLYLT